MNKMFLNVKIHNFRKTKNYYAAALGIGKCLQDRVQAFRLKYKIKWNPNLLYRVAHGKLTKYKSH